MLRLAVALALVAAATSPTRADACFETLPDLGRVACRPHRSEEGRGVWFEGGVAWLRFVPAVTGEPYNAPAVAVRALSRNGSWHFGFEFEYARLGPQSGTPADVSARTTGPVTTPAMLGGDLAQTKLVAGRRANAGPFTFGGEVAAGIQVANYKTTDEPPQQAWALLELHGQIDLWLAPKLTLAVQSSFDLANTDRAQIALLVGYHLRAFDGTR